MKFYKDRTDSMLTKENKLRTIRKRTNILFENLHYASILQNKLDTHNSNDVILLRIFHKIPHEQASHLEMQNFLFFLVGIHNTGIL